MEYSKPTTLAKAIVPQTRNCGSGFVLLTMLLFVLIVTMAAGKMVQSYQTATQREKETQLLFVGNQYRRAIASYYNITPGTARTLPPTLDALLNDPRFPSPVQHLRKLYPDPMTGRTDWILVFDRGGVMGVKSASTQAPMKVAGFSPRDKEFEAKSSYSDWIFAIKIQ